MFHVCLKAKSLYKTVVHIFRVSDPSHPLVKNLKLPKQAFNIFPILVLKKNVKNVTALKMHIAKATFIGVPRVLV